MLGHDTCFSVGTEVLELGVPRREVEVAWGGVVAGGGLQRDLEE